jgi:energy-coupling factor transporter ATP-binding protein EcfA2
MSSLVLPHLRIVDLSFRYPQIGEEAAPFVFSGLSFNAVRGGVSVLLGSADAGKTTLARIVAGLVPRFTGGALRGSVLLAGKDTGGARPFELVEKVGMVSQDSDEQIFTTRCDTEVAFALESLGMPRTQMVERVRQSLSRLGLWEFRGRNPSTLSGGEKKRLLISCLAAVDPELWILDESLEELDSSWKRRLLDMLGATGRTVLALDSRRSALLAERGGSFTLLVEGRIKAASVRMEEPGFRAQLLAHGLIGREDERTAAPRAAVPVLKATGVAFDYSTAPGAFSLAVDSLVLRKAETCSLVGSNGSGKSTLGRLLCGLLQPQRGGMALAAGNGWRAASASELNVRVGYLFQNPDHQIYLPTVREELSLGLARESLSRREIDRRIEHAVALFGLRDPEATPSLMSYGARRRLQAATYYLLDRELLILDEVDSGLSWREVISLISALAGQGRGIVLITHDLALARAVSDRILLMASGAIAGDFLPDRFTQAEQALIGAAEG